MSSDEDISFLVSNENVNTPKLVTNEIWREAYDDTEKPKNLVPWVYEEGDYVPSAKLVGDRRYSNRQ